MSFADRFNEALIYRDLTLHAMEERSGLEFSMLQRYSAGISLPKMYTAYDLATALDVSLDWLCGRPYHNRRKYLGKSGKEIIQQAMKEMGVIEAQLLREAGISPDTFSRLLNGDNVSYQSMIKVADYLEISLDYMLGLGIMDRPHCMGGN